MCISTMSDTIYGQDHFFLAILTLRTSNLANYYMLFVQFAIYEFAGPDCLYGFYVTVKSRWPDLPIPSFICIYIYIYIILNVFSS